MPLAYVLHFNMQENEKTEIISDVKTEIIPASTMNAEISPSMDKLEDFFSIKSKVGDGGMGVVYLAKDIRLNRYVAIKRLKPQFLVDAQIRKRFLHEAKAVASLNNANIVHIYFIGEDNDGPYFVMEYIEGAVVDTEHPNQPNPPQTLEQYIATNGVMNIDEAVDFMVKVGGAVTAAHASGVIHRDLKPTNILIDIANFPKIVDFGLARITHGDVAVSSLTVKGDKFISLGYGAPEQEQDASITDERADIYGLGGIAYYILTGKNPRFFREDDLPERIKPVIIKALATNREQRWPTAESFVAALIQCKTDSAVERPTVKTTWRCKWCDTINPLSTRYCGSCGWDGGTVCPECGAPNHFGVMFCSTCGANCKEYERVQLALDEMRTAFSAAQYENVLANNTKPLNFDPIGPNGRKLIDEINQIYSEAKKKQERRNELAEIISMEINAENYERAERFIKEFRMISSSDEAYETELSEFGRLKQRRDLARVAKAFSINDWEFGISLLQTIKSVEGSANTLEYRRLDGIYKKHLRRKHMRRYPMILIFVLIYIFSLPVAANYLPRGFVRVVWYPANLLVRGLFLAQPVEKVAKSLGDNDVATIFVSASSKSSKDTGVKRNLGKPAEFQKKFEENHKAFHVAYEEKEKSLQTEYIDELSKLSDDFKNEANMEAWVMVRNEINSFKSNPNKIELLKANTDAANRIIGIQKVHILKRDSSLVSIYRDFMVATNNDLNELDRIVKDLMHKSLEAEKSGDAENAEALMAEAEAYHNIGKTIKQNNFYISGVTFIKSFDEKYPNFASSLYLPDSDKGSISQIMAESLQKFETKMMEFSDQRRAKELLRHKDYYAELEALLTKRREAGDFDGVSLITKEQERFTQNQVIVMNTASTELSALTKKFVAREQKDMHEIDVAVLAFVDKYIAELDKRVSEETKANNLQLAAVIDAERKRIQTMSEILEIRERSSYFNK